MTEVNREDLAGALKRAGADRTFIDTQDYESVLINDLSDTHLKIDDQDLPAIVGGKTPDTTAPTSSTLAPLDNATGVSVNVTPAVTFNGPIIFSPLDKTFTLKKTSDNSVIETWHTNSEVGSGAGKMEIIGNAVHLHLTSALAAATGYYIIWDAGVVHDVAGNPVAAQASTTAWSFTTA